jgi:hypothetical protein
VSDRHTHKETVTVTRVGEYQTVGAKGYTKRELRGVTDGDYPQTLAFEFGKDKGRLLDSIGVGDTVTVSFDVRGREWNEKCFVSLSGYAIEIDGAKVVPQAQQAHTETITPAEREVAQGDPMPF